MLELLLNSIVQSTDFYLNCFDFFYKFYLVNSEKIIEKKYSKISKYLNSQLSTLDAA